MAVTAEHYARPEISEEQCTTGAFTHANGGEEVADSKQYRGRPRLDSDGLLWHGRHLLTMTLHTLRWEADPAAEVLGRRRR
jgi:hypothetical protein